MASCLKSWKVKSINLARLRSLSHDCLNATSVIGNTWSVDCGTLFNIFIALSDKGTHLDKPFFVMGRNTLFLGVISFLYFVIRSWRVNDD